MEAGSPGAASATPETLAVTGSTFCANGDAPVARSLLYYAISTLVVVALLGLIGTAAYLVNTASVDFHRIWPVFFVFSGVALLIFAQRDSAALSRQVLIFLNEPGKDTPSFPEEGWLVPGAIEFGGIGLIAAGVGYWISGSIELVLWVLGAGYVAIVVLGLLLVAVARYRRRQL